MVKLYARLKKDLIVLEGAASRGSTVCLLARARGLG